MAGRKKKPNAQRIIDGQKPRPEPKQAEATGSIPDWLPPEGQAWLEEHGDRIRMEMGVRASDEPMLHMMAATFGNAIAAQQLVNQEGLLAPDRDQVTMRKHPGESIFRAQATLFVAMATRFGLSPVDRLRLMQPETREAEDDILDGNFKRLPDWKASAGGVQ
jgi:phage terminase small subunit